MILKWNLQYNIPIFSYDQVRAYCYFSLSIALWYCTYHIVIQLVPLYYRHYIISNLSSKSKIDVFYGMLGKKGPAVDIYSWQGQNSETSLATYYLGSVPMKGTRMFRKILPRTIIPAIGGTFLRITTRKLITPPIYWMGCPGYSNC